ncbi:MAG: tetratricopeptide repeat protein [Candidatus Obscuribacter sp.]|nr:tetratricopeptide repeat protein [Candidatus Obscuribacter sp.]MBK9278205.1 tetratricopeptide repeat protein [Candidatus Obscuribacter sp.]
MKTKTLSATSIVILALNCIPAVSAGNIAATGEGRPSGNDMLTPEYRLCEEGLKQSRMNDSDKALQLFTKAISCNSDYARAYLDRGCTFRLARQDMPARQDFKRVTQLIHTPRSCADHFMLGTALQELGQHEAAISHLQAATALKPLTLLDRMCLSRSYIALGDLENAKLAISDYLQENPQSAPAHELRADISTLTEARLEQAVQDLSRAIDLEPAYRTALTKRAALYNRLGNYSSGLADGKTAYLLEPNNPDILLSLGISHQGMGEPQAAMAAFKKVISLDETWNVPYLYLADLNSLQGHDRIALSLATRAIELEPQDPNGYFCRARILHKANRLTEALQDVNQGIQHDNHHSICGSNLRDKIDKALDEESRIKALLLLFLSSAVLFGAYSSRKEQTTPALSN